MRARTAALTRWSRSDPAKASEAARVRIERRFELEVDPEGLLDPADRAVRADRAKKAYFANLALKSSQARRKARTDG